MIVSAVAPAGRLYSGPEFYPLWEEAQRLDVPVSTHGGLSMPALGLDMASNFTIGHTLEHPFAQRPEVLAYVGVGARLPEDDRAQHDRVVVPEPQPPRQSQQRADRVAAAYHVTGLAQWRLGQSFVEQRTQDVDLAREVVEDQALRDTGVRGDRRGAGRIEPVLREPCLGRVEDAFSTVGRGRGPHRDGPAGWPGPQRPAAP